MSPPKLETLLNTPVCAGIAVSDDDAWLLTSSNLSGVYNAVEVPLTGGDPKARTFSEDDAIFVLDYLPGSRRFLFARDRGGDEISHLFLCEEDGSIRELTPWEGVRCVPHGFLHDRSAYLFTANKRDQAKMDVWALDIQTLEPRLVWENDDGFELACVSRNGQRLAFVKPHTTLNSDIWLVDQETDEKRLLTEHEGNIQYSALAFEPDGDTLWIATDEDADYQSLVRLGLITGRKESAWAPGGDVVGYWISEQGAYRARTRDHDAEIMLYLAPNGEAPEQVEIPVGQVTAFRFSRSQRYAAMLVGTPTCGATPWVQDLESGELSSVMTRPDRAPDPELLVQSSHLYFPSYDELEVPGVLYPAQGRAEGEAGPGLIWVHGGPGGQSRLRFDPLLQSLALAGYEVFAVNNRGSSGYGKNFFSLDKRAHGDVDLRDCIAAKQVLIDTGRVDPKRIGIAGGSYGGFMVLAALAFRPGEFTCGVDIFGVSNWLRTLSQMPVWWESVRELLYEEMGHPEEDEEYLRKISPLFHAEKIDVPLMVLQGANDPRVLQAESDEIVESLRARDVPVEYIVFEDEGHGFQKIENQLEGYGKVREFLERYL